MYPGFNSISQLEAQETDKDVIQNRKEFREGFETGLKLIGYVFFTSYILKEVFQLPSVHAVDNFQNAVDNAELQPTATIEKVAIVGEILRKKKNRNFNLNVLFGLLVALFFSFLAGDTIRNGINIREDERKLTQLGEGVIEISKIIDQKYKVLLEFEENARKYGDLL